MPGAAYHVLVMLVNCRNISILDEKATEARGQKLSDPFGLQYIPLGRALELWLFKRKRKHMQNREKSEKWLYCVQNQGGQCVLQSQFLLSVAAPKLVTQLQRKPAQICMGTPTGRWTQIYFRIHLLLICTRKLLWTNGAPSFHLWLLCLFSTGKV